MFNIENNRTKKFKFVENLLKNRNRKCLQKHTKMKTVTFINLKEIFQLVFI